MASSKVRLTVRVGEDVYEELKRLAAWRGRGNHMGLSMEVQKALIRYTEEEGKERRKMEEYKESGLLDELE